MSAAVTTGLETIGHWIGGEIVRGDAGRKGPVYNPATGEQSGEVDFASPEDVDRAVRTAAAAYREWRRVSLSKRQDLFFRIYDLFDEFDISPTAINFELGNTGTNVKKKCADVLRHIEDNLKGEFMSGVHCLCSPEFFDALTDHAKVKDAFTYWQQGVVLINDMRAGFTYGGITFEEYRGQATDAGGTSRRFIAAGEAHCFPLGTVDTFGTYFAPADFNETANTLGQPLYAKQEPRKFDRGTDLHTQSNPLPMCHRPGVLVKLTSS